MGTVHTQGHTSITASASVVCQCLPSLSLPVSWETGVGVGVGWRLSMLTKVLTEKSQEGSSPLSSLLVEACILMGHQLISP